MTYLAGGRHYYLCLAGSPPFPRRKRQMAFIFNELIGNNISPVKKMFAEN
jgi:hypothetical protein